MAEERHEWFLNQIFHHRGALQRYVGKLTSGAQDIEDLVQETYLRVYSLPDFHVVSRPRRSSFASPTIWPSSGRDGKKPSAPILWRIWRR